MNLQKLVEKHHPASDIQLAYDLWNYASWINILKFHYFTIPIFPKAKKIKYVPEMNKYNDSPLTINSSSHLAPLLWFTNPRHHVFYCCLFRLSIHGVHPKQHGAQDLETFLGDGCIYIRGAHTHTHSTSHMQYPLFLRHTLCLWTLGRAQSTQRVIPYPGVNCCTLKSLIP